MKDPIIFKITSQIFQSNPALQKFPYEFLMDSIEHFCKKNAMHIEEFGSAIESNSSVKDNFQSFLHEKSETSFDNNLKEIFPVIFNASDDLIALFECRTDAVYLLQVNASFQKAVKRFGLNENKIGQNITLNEFLEKTLQLQPFQLEYIFSKVDQLFASQKEVNYVEKVTFPTGIYYLQSSIVPIFTNNKLTHFIYNSNDISDAKLKEKTIEESQYRFKQLSRLTDEAVLIHQQGHLIDFNEKVCELLGYSKDEILTYGESLLKNIMSTEDLAKVYEKMQTQSEDTYEVEIITNKGQKIPIEIKAKNCLYHEKPSRVISMRNISIRKEFEKKIESEKEKFKSLIRNFPEIVLTTDSEYNITYINKTENGYDKEALMGKKIYEFSPVTDKRVYTSTIDKVFRYGKVLTYVTSSINPVDGKLNWYSTQVAPIFEDKVVTQVICTIKNITSEKLYKDQKEKFIQEILSFSEVLDEVMYSINIKSKDIIWRGNAHKNFGYTIEELNSHFTKGISELIYAADRNNYIESFNDALIHEDIFKAEYRIINSKGKKVWFLEKTKIKRDRDNQPEEVIGIISNIHDMKMVEEQRVKSVVKGVDEERARIARELHDGLGQSLIAVSMNLDLLKNYNATKDEYISSQLDTAIQMMNVSIDEIRNISHNLMPKSLKDFGLILSLENLINRFKKNSKTEIVFIHQGFDNHVLKEDIEINIYRVIQESINNIYKHSFAKKAEIQLYKYEDMIMLTIEDNGAGFDISENNSSGIGIENIKNRVNAINGLIYIESAKNKGTLLTIEIPIE